MILIEKRIMPLFGRVLFNIAVANLGAKIATAILLTSPFRNGEHRTIKRRPLVALNGAWILQRESL